MIGILIVTHMDLGGSLIDALEFITGQRPQNMEAVSIDLNENADKLRNKIASAIKQVNQHQGVLILTDMFGGSPSNLSYSFLEEGRIEVLSGVNLPIVMKAEDKRKSMPLEELAPMLEKFGKRSISLASGILQGNKRTAC